jgi:5,10-methylenetetrahydromethanopterin reductase
MQRSDGRVDFGAVVGSPSEARALERLGYAFIGQGDHLATFSNLAEVARNTTVAQFGSFILTAYGRHPSVTAMESSAIQGRSGGRLVVVVGRGFRSAALMGRGPVTVSETRDYVKALRTLLRGEPSCWGGDEIPALRDVESVPVLLSAYGPIVRRLAGAVADGAVLAAGSDLEHVRSCIDDLKTGAKLAGRDVGELQIWLLCRAAVGADRAEAIVAIRGLLAASAYRHLGSQTQQETIPEGHRTAVAELRQRYDPRGFEGYQPSWDGPNARLVSELGLDEFLAGRFALVGSPDEIKSQAATLGAEGVSRIVFAPGGRDAGVAYERLAAALM